MGQSTENSIGPDHRIAIVILAAGRSTRMGDKNKLLLPYHGRPMISQVVSEATKVCANVYVIVGHESQSIQSELSGQKVTIVENPNYFSGLSSSLVAGIRALSLDIEAAIICLGDMPRIEANHLRKLINAYDPRHNHSICLPVFSGKRGNPILWGRQYFPDMLKLGGDKGARELLKKYPDQVLEVQMADNGIHFDIDTSADLAKQ